jgi:hypothetical protein
MGTKHTPATLADEFERRAEVADSVAGHSPFNSADWYKGHADGWREAAAMLREAIKQESDNGR